MYRLIRAISSEIIEHGNKKEEIKISFFFFLLWINLITPFSFSTIAAWTFCCLSSIFRSRYQKTQLLVYSRNRLFLISLLFRLDSWVKMMNSRRRRRRRRNLSLLRWDPLLICHHGLLWSPSSAVARVWDLGSAQVRWLLSRAFSLIPTTASLFLSSSPELWRRRWLPFLRRRLSLSLLPVCLILRGFFRLVK